MFSFVNGAVAAESGLAEVARVIEALVLVQSSKRRHLLRAQVEVIDGDVLNKALDLARLGDRNGAALHSPAE